METLLLVAVGSLGALFLWGLISPRTQWKLLVSWSQRDPHADEPTGAAYGLYRVVAFLAIAAMVTSGLLVYRARIDSLPPPPVPQTALQQMWGTPDPVIVNRVAGPAEAMPEGLVDQPILGYQLVDGQTRQPPYLFSLKPFSMKSATTENGLFGADPGPGLVALDTARLVVEVAGDPRCFVHQIVVVQGSDSVKIGVYYGQANPADGSNAENLGDCNVKASGLAVTTLLPIDLIEPLKKRPVLTLDGEAIREIPLIQ